ncbi:HEAT repeat domain-containing protein [Lysobacter fragariae]
MDEGVAFDRFAMPQDVRLDVLDPAKQLVATGSGMLQPGQTLVINGATDVYDFHSALPDCLVMKAMSPVKRDFTWSFDRSTLRAWNISSANQVDDQLMTALDALGNLGDAKVASTVERFLGAKSHHVRWKALQVLNELAPELALAAFEPFLNDPHPHIRAAANRAVNQPWRSVSIPAPPTSWGRQSSWTMPRATSIRNRTKVSSQQPTRWRCSAIIEPSSSTSSTTTCARKS